MGSCDQIPDTFGSLVFPKITHRQKLSSLTASGITVTGYCTEGLGKHNMLATEKS